MSIAERPIGDDEIDTLFRGLEDLPCLLIAASGGPDSTALLLLAARWAKRRRRAPKLLAVTVDHGLRRESAAEAAAVKRLAQRLGLPHRTVRWRGNKPGTGLQEAARAARYRLLAEVADKSAIAHILTAHTLDDQAETVLFRLARGSGLTGLSAMTRISPLPYRGREYGEHSGFGRSPGSSSYSRKPGANIPGLPGNGGSGQTGSAGGQIVLVRPFLQVPKSRLVATLAACGIEFADDPSNSDPRFTRPRLRALMPALAREGLDARSLARLAARMRRADATIEFAVSAAAAALGVLPGRGTAAIMLDAHRFGSLPAEVGLRLLGRTIAQVGTEGPVELGKLESLYDELVHRFTEQQADGPAAGGRRLRRTLAGAMVTLAGRRLSIEPAPPRRGSAMPAKRNRRFTK